MENEILWKWELLCTEFEEAKNNYTTIFAPLFKSIGERVGKANEIYSDDILLQIEKAESALQQWGEIQIKLKSFVEENT